jgi:hypothetical protein
VHQLLADTQILEETQCVGECVQVETTVPAAVETNKNLAGGDNQAKVIDDGNGHN